MDIKELEFIRDFADLLGNLQTDMLNVAQAIDDGDEDEQIKEVSLSNVNFTWSLVHHVEKLEKLLYSFKEKIDEKYHHVWREAHPHMPETYAGMMEHLDQIK